MNRSTAGRTWSLALDKIPVACADRAGVVSGWISPDDAAVPFTPSGITRIDGGIEARYSSSNGLEITDILKRRSEGVYVLRRTWRNQGLNTMMGTALLELNPLYTATFSMIPGVMYDGNAFGGGGEPKGLQRDNKAWAFAYDRSGLPSATFSEDGAVALGLMAAADSPESLNSSGSLRTHAGALSHRLMWPAREDPVAYTGRDIYAPAWRDTLTLRPGETFAATAYIFLSKVEHPNTGWFAAYDAALDLYEPAPPIVPDPEALWAYGIAYGLRLVVREGRHTLTHKGFLPNEGDSGWHLRPSRQYEVGWCGQNLVFAHAFLHQALEGGLRTAPGSGVSKRNDEALRDMALSIADSWVATRRPNGLLAVLYDPLLTGEAFPPADVCNLGWAMLKLLDLCRLAEKHGLERRGWRSAALGIADFLIARYTDEHLFGRVYGADGALEDGGGTIGCFALPGILAAFDATGDARYLDAAKKAYSAYAARDLARMACSAGALDTDCIDKETSWPMIRAGIELYEITGDAAFLQGAVAAAYYFTSWMYHYEPLYAAETDFAREGFRVTGMTSVSTQHHHLDPWGALASPDIERLSELTGDNRWARRADLLWKAAAQCVSDGRKPIRGRVRPLGSQNESFLHTRWGSRQDAQPRGQMNDWLVAWPAAFRLEALLRKRAYVSNSIKEEETP